METRDEEYLRKFYEGEVKKGLVDVKIFLKQDPTILKREHIAGMARLVQAYVEGRTRPLDLKSIA